MARPSPGGYSGATVMFWYSITVLQLLWMIAVAIFIILQRRSPAATLAWIFGLTLLPVVGILVYLVFGPQRLKRKQIRRAMAREAIARWTGGRGLTTVDLPRLTDPRHQRISKVGERSGITSVTTRNAVRIFFDGDECFDAILEAIEAAEHHIHLEYYIFEPGVLQRRLSEALMKKAREGAEVRLLLDGFGSKGLKRRFRRPLIDAGVEVAFFNSIHFSRLKPTLANFRTHRKIVVVDGCTAFTGGMNIMDEQSFSVCGSGAWRDTHLRIAGPAALSLQMLFLEDWHYAAASAPEDAAYLPRPEMPEEGTYTQIVGSGPDDGVFGIHGVLFAALGEATSRVLATTPYFVPDEPILAALTAAALRGIDVQLLLPQRVDSFLVDAASRSYYRDLLDAGVRVFQYQPSLIHAKTVVIDDDIAIVGSANLDNRSFRLNFEVIAVLYDEGCARALADQFARDLGSARAVSVPIGGLSVRRRLVQDTARLFSPIL